MSVTKSTQARQDLVEHYERIAADKREPAERFFDVAEESFELLARMPGIGRKWNSPNPRLSGVHVYPLPKGFRNYLVFFRPGREGIEILRILHGSRDLEIALEDLP